MSFARAALDYAARGWLVFPLRPGRKEPFHGRGLYTATRDTTKIDLLWDEKPTANIGIRTGTLVVIDVDSIEALKSLHALGPLPRTLMAKTGKGLHLYFSNPGDEIRNSQGRIADGIDVRGEGGYVLAPPSVHPSGAVYTWLDPKAEVVPLPDWLRALAMPTEPYYQLATPTNTLIDSDRAERIVQTKLTALTLAPSGQKHGALLDASMAIAGLVKAGHSDEPTMTKAMLDALARNEDPPANWANARATIRSAFEKATPTVEALEREDLAHTEAAFGRRFAKTHHGDLRYVMDLKVWAYREGPLWRIAYPGEDPIPHATAMIQEIMDNPPIKEDFDPAEWRKNLKKFHSHRSLSAILAVAKRQPCLATTRAAFDQDPHVLGTPEGPIDVRTGAPTNALTTLRTGIGTNKAIAGPQWRAALDTWTGGDKDLQGYLARVFGSCLIRRPMDEHFWVLRGDGANGKSAFLRLIALTMGDYAGPIMSDFLVKGQNSPHTSAIGGLVGKGLVYCEEMASGTKLSMDRIKLYCGVNKVRVQLGMGAPFQMVSPTWKLVITTNHDPIVQDRTKGARRRYTVVPFDHPVPKGDPAFVDNLFAAEGPAIFQWLLDGCQAYIRSGLGRCAAIERRTAEAHEDEEQGSEEQDLDEFLATRTIQGPDLDIKFSLLYTVYREAGGSMSKNLLARKLKARGYPAIFKGDTSISYRKGLGLPEEIARQYQVRFS